MLLDTFILTDWRGEIKALYYFLFTATNGYFSALSFLKKSGPYRLLLAQVNANAKSRNVA